MLTGVIATETVNALENSTDVTSDDNNSSDDYNEIIKLFGEDDFAGYDDGYDEGNDSSISNNGTSLESYDLEKYLQDWKIDSNSTTIRRCSADNTDRDFDCRNQNKPSCISIKSCNTDGCNTDNSAGNLNLNHILSLLCLLTTAVLMR